jgi:hypothetical protein
MNDQNKLKELEDINGLPVLGCSGSIEVCGHNCNLTEVGRMTS